MGFLNNGTIGSSILPDIIVRVYSIFFSGFVGLFLSDILWKLTLLQNSSSKICMWLPQFIHCHVYI